MALFGACGFLLRGDRDTLVGGCARLLENWIVKVLGDLWSLSEGTAGLDLSFTLTLSRVGLCVCLVSIWTIRRLYGFDNRLGGWFSKRHFIVVVVSLSLRTNVFIYLR